jgi:hypothetical protein
MADGDKSVETELAETKNWLLSVEEREKRSLLLNDWAISVQPDLDKAQQLIKHSVTYGSTALQAGYILNGGALAALPALSSSLSHAGTESIANAAIPFICGIAVTAISSLCAYLNFQFHAYLAWHDAGVVAARIRELYNIPASEPSNAVRDRLSTKINWTFRVGLIAGVLSLVFFVYGSWQFIDLARHMAK